MSDPVITDLAAYQAAQNTTELQQLAHEHELALQLADTMAIGTLLLERIGDRDTPESVRESLAGLLGSAVRAAHEGKPLAEVGRTHPVFCGWALAQVDQRVAGITKLAA
jgi:hypothetical protein